MFGEQAEETEVGNESKEGICMGRKQFHKGKSIWLPVMAITITAIMMVASTSVIAAKGGKPGKPDSDESGIDSGENVIECRFDESTIIWIHSKFAKNTHTYTLKAYDLGINGFYKDDDDGTTTTLASPVTSSNEGMDIQGDYVVWVERGSQSADLYSWNFDSDEVISSTNGQRVALQTDGTINEGNPNIWGSNVVFRTYPVNYDTTPPPFTYYIRNFADDAALKLEGVTYAVLWDNFLAIQMADGGHAIVDLGVNKEFDGFTTDVPNTVPGLNGWTLKLFEFGLAIYYQKDETDGTYDWKYIEVSSTGSVTDPTTLWSDTKWRGFMETNGEIIAYQKGTTKKGGFLVFDIVLHNMDGSSLMQITDESKTSSWVRDIDENRLMYSTTRGGMYFYHFGTGTHEQLS